MDSWTGLLKTFAVSIDLYCSSEAENTKNIGNMSDSDENSLLTEKGIENSSPPKMLIAENSKIQYKRAYTKFMNWRKKENISSLSEQVLLTYFQDMSTHKSPPTVWTEYSMIKSTLKTYENTDISKFKRLHSFLKQNSKGYKARQSKTFTLSEINTFIKEADDDMYLAIKVAVIFGVVGACGMRELHDLTIQQIKDLNGTLLVNINKNETEIDRTFTITGQCYLIVKKYIALRPKLCKTTNFFVQYAKGKCVSQNIGKHTFENMGREVAKYLKLENSKLYTGHCFRKTSITLLNNADGDNNGRKSKRVSSGDIQNKTVIKQVALPAPGTSKSPIEINQNIRNSSYSPSSKPQHPQTRKEQCCRFCGEFKQHCVSVCYVTYLSDTTTLAFNDITVHLDFRDVKLPNSVCPNCNMKLQQMYEFVKVVKDAQESLFNVAVKDIKDKPNDAVEEFESLIKTEVDNEETMDDQEDGSVDEDSKDGILDIGETIFIKRIQTQKRKANTISDEKPKKARVIDKSKNEETKLMTKEEVVEIVEPFCFDIKFERDNTDAAANDDDAYNKESFVSDTGTVKSSADLTTKDLVFEVRTNGGEISQRNS